jgi:ferredoxin--NADP+ reductase
MAQWLRGTVAHTRRWNDTHYSLVISASGPSFVAGQFIRVGMDLDGERVGRPYSLVNPPHQAEHEIFFNIVPDGPLSGELAALEAGDSLWLTDAANGFLTLDEVPAHTRDLWLLATGTGVGPFLSMLQTAEPWHRFDHVILGYGVRKLGNLAYRDLIGQLEQDHPEKFRFVPFVTGESAADAFGCRIPETLVDGRLERRVGVSLDPDRSHVMLCGHSGMIVDTMQILEQRGMRRHRRREPGHISAEKYH